MRLAWLTLGVGYVVLLLGAQCGMDKDQMKTSTQASLRVIRFPQPWSKAGSNGERTILTAPQKFVVRRTQDVSGGELLFAVQEPGGALSENIYAVTLDGKFAVHPVNAQAWRQAQEMPVGDGAQLSKDSTQTSAEATAYNGKAFAKTGAFWSQPTALSSGRRDWLAVFSYNSPERVENDASTDVSKFIGGGEPGKGEVLVDIYQTSSGEKVLNGNSSFTGVGPSFLFSQAIWADDRFFIMPLDSLSQTCFLGILPRQ